MSAPATREGAHAALVEALGRGYGIPCIADPRDDDWYAETRAARSRAAERCRGECPVLVECRTYADAARERWGVWGGTDRNTNGRAPNPAPQPQEAS